MLKKIIDASTKNVFITFFIFICLVVIGLVSIKKISYDAIPDLSDTQVIVYSKWNVSPDIIEDQVTYPIISQLLGVPKVKISGDCQHLDHLMFMSSLRIILISTGQDQES